MGKRNYEIAQLWREDGLDVEEKVAKLKAHDYWVSERNYNIDRMQRLIDSAKETSKKAFDRVQRGFRRRVFKGVPDAVEPRSGHR